MRVKNMIKGWRVRRASQWVRQEEVYDWQDWPKKCVLSFDAMNDCADENMKAMI